MIRVARSRPLAERARVRFTVGDARSLDEPDGSFDVVRSERTLQWLADPTAAVAEMVRVVRSGGRISLIDTDWSTFTIDIGDEELAGLVRDGMRTERHRASNVGGRLHELVGAAGCVPAARTRATQTWTTGEFPVTRPHPLGASPWRASPTTSSPGIRLATADRGQFVSKIHDAARRGQFSMRLTMFAVVAAVP